MAHDTMLLRTRCIADRQTLGTAKAEAKKTALSYSTLCIDGCGGVASSMATVCGKNAITRIPCSYDGAAICSLCVTEILLFLSICLRSRNLTVFGKSSAFCSQNLTIFDNLLPSYPTGTIVAHALSIRQVQGDLKKAFVY